MIHHFEPLRAAAGDMLPGWDCASDPQREGLLDAVLSEIGEPQRFVGSDCTGGLCAGGVGWLHSSADAFMKSSLLVSSEKFPMLFSFPVCLVSRASLHQQEHSFGLLFYNCNLFASILFSGLPPGIIPDVETFSL